MTRLCPNSAESPHVLSPGHPSFYIPDPSFPYNRPRLSYASQASVPAAPVNGARYVSQPGRPSADRL